MADTLVTLLRYCARQAYATDRAEARLRRLWRERRANAPYEERVFAPDPRLEEIRSVLIFKPDEIGDAVYGLSAVAELKQALPGAKFFLLCKKVTAPIYALGGLFDEIATTTDLFEGVPGVSWVPTRRPLATLSARKFDVAVFLRPHPRCFKSFLRIPCDRRVHMDDPRMRSPSILRAQVDQLGPARLHIGLQMLKIVSPLTGKQYTVDDVRLPPLHWSDKDRAVLAKVFPTGIPERFGVLHPFVRDQSRQYPLEHWEALLSGLRQQFSIPWIVIGGPQDPAINFLPAAVQTQGRLSITETAYLLSRAAVMLGVHSGPVHLAAAMGTPTVTLFGGKDAGSEFAPLGKSLILRTELTCSPCSSGSCPLFHVACMRELTPARILPKIVSFVQSHSPFQSN